MSALGRFVRIGALLLLLGACESVPRPFLGSVPTANNPLMSIGLSAGVHVMPVVGASQATSDLIAQTLAEQLGRYNIPAATVGAPEGRYRLQGRANLDLLQPGAPVVRAIDWTMTDAAGKTVGTFHQPVPGGAWQWDKADPRTVKAVAVAAARPIASMAQGRTAEPVSQGLDEVLNPRAASGVATHFEGGRGVYVAPVAGAPGDGNQALAQAMRSVLDLRRIRIVQEKAKAEFFVTGEVRMSAAQAGRQTIAITWSVTDDGGFDLGQADQKNAIPAGALDGKWGSVAFSVADAAADGVQQIIARAPLERAARGGLALPPGTGTPPRHDLKQVPGRGPPPPS